MIEELERRLARLKMEMDIRRAAMTLGRVLVYLYGVEGAARFADEWLKRLKAERVRH